MAIVIGSIAVVAMFLSSQTRDLILGASDELQNASQPTVKSRTTKNDTETATADSPLSETIAHWLPSRKVAVRVAVASAALVVIVSCVVYWIRRRREAPSEPPAEKRPAAPSGDELETQLYARRQRILQALINDTGLLVQSKMQVRHLLGGKPATVLASSTREEIAAAMKKQNANYLLVCDKQGHYLGQLGQRDLAQPAGKRAVDFLDNSLVTVRPDAPVSQAIALLMDARQSCLPVVRDRKLCGCLTKDDLVLTLQCALQLFVRVAQFAHLESDESDSVDNAAMSVEHELSAQNQRFDRLQQLIGGIEEDGDEASRASLANEGKRILDQGRDLVGQIDALQQHMSQQFERLTSVFDLSVDPETGAGNRRSFHTLLSMHADLSQRYDLSFSVLLIAVDAWSASENRLKSVAEWLTQTVRSVDTVTRYDAETFALILPHIGLEGAEQTANRLLASALDEEWNDPANPGSGPLRAAAIAVRPDEPRNDLRTRLEELVQDLRESEPGTLLLPDGIRLERGQVEAVR